MSLESAKACIEKMKADEAFRKLVQEAGSDEKRLEVCKAAGFDFTMEEFGQAREQHGELSEEDLDNVAGGCFVHGCKVHF